MRKYVFIGVVCTLMVGVLFGGFLQSENALASPGPLTSQCATLSTWTGSFYFEQGDIISAIYTATSGGPGAEIMIGHKGPDNQKYKMPVPGPGQYVLSMTIPLDGVYIIGNKTVGATGSFSDPICGLVSLSTGHPYSDSDDDGIPNSRDNCPAAFNPGQEDGWGSAAGDECDTDWYNNTGFEQKDGSYHLHGNCTYMADGAPRCPVIGNFDPATLTPDTPVLDVTTVEAGTWSVVVHYLHSNNGYPVYQVNVYSTNPPQPDTLVDDRLELHVYGGSWRWHMRGGSSNFNGT